MSSTNKTSKLGLSQYIGSDQPKYLTDYNDDMARIDNYVGKVTRTATLVVGLESMGYTADQVDVLIKPADNVSAKIAEAITKLPSIGGEIKLLEGEYGVNADIILKDRTYLCGVGSATTITGMILTNLDNKKISLSNFSVKKNLQNSDPSFIYVGNGTKLSCYNLFNENDSTTNTINLYYATAESYANLSNLANFSIVNKNTSNWRNIWIDGETISPNNRVRINNNGIVNIVELLIMGESGPVHQYTFPVTLSSVYSIQLTTMITQGAVSVKDLPSSTGVEILRTGINYAFIHVVGHV